MIFWILSHDGKPMSDKQNVDQARWAVGGILLIGGFFLISQRGKEAATRQEQVDRGELPLAEATKRNQAFARFAWLMTFAGLAWMGYLIFFYYGLSVIVYKIEDFLA